MKQRWQITSSGGTMHDYKHKYGTMSGGSALSKSMKYAETWLYGSMSARPHSSRPSIFMYPEPESPSVILGTPQPGGYALVMCACKEFLAGTTRSKKSSPVCKKCGGSRKTTWGSNSSTAIRGFGTVRLTQPKSRQELPFLDELKDPYDLMRKSRLATVSSTLRVPPDGRSRAKSNSPARRRKRSKTPPRHRSPDTRFTDKRTLNVNKLVDKNDASNRKSILECDVNPYELISQYLKNGDSPDSRFPMEDDELSDNLSENALDDESFDSSRRPKSRSMEDKRKAKKSATVGSRSKKGFLDALKNKWDEQSRNTDSVPGGVSIGGQRIRLFNNSDPLPAVTHANEFVSDSEEIDEEEIYDMEKHQAWFSDKASSDTSTSKINGSQISRFSSSPKRPPRKTKSPLEPVNKKPSPKISAETGGKNRVNFALDVPTQTNRRSNSLTSSASLEIKSILKKPNSVLNLADSKPSQKSTTPNAKTDSSSSETGSRSVTPTSTKNFRLPTFKDQKQLQNRKKKQVQFKVSDCSESPSEGSLTIAEIEEDNSIPPEKTPEVVVTNPECSEVLRLQFFGDNKEDTHAVNQGASENLSRVVLEVKEEEDTRNKGKILESISLLKMAILI